MVKTRVDWATAGCRLHPPKMKERRETRSAGRWTHFFRKSGNGESWSIKGKRLGWGGAAWTPGGMRSGDSLILETKSCHEIAFIPVQGACVSRADPLSLSGVRANRRPGDTTWYRVNFAKTWSPTVFSLARLAKGLCGNQTWQHRLYQENKNPSAQSSAFICLR